jgi:hypothetical protein
MCKTRVTRALIFAGAVVIPGGLLVLLTLWLARAPRAQLVDAGLVTLMLATVGFLIWGPY